MTNNLDVYVNNITNLGRLGFVETHRSTENANLIVSLRETDFLYAPLVCIISAMATYIVYAYNIIILQGRIALLFAIFSPTSLESKSIISCLYFAAQLFTRYMVYMRYD
jgi:glucan phosphoethanolaminetransferase (alkaline phosphatase superfamily)